MVAAVVRKCWVVEIEYQARVWALELAPGGEHKRHIPGSVLKPPMLLSKSFGHCWLVLTSGIEDVLHKHLRLSKWKVISNSFYYCRNFAFYVENWSAIVFQSLLYILKLSIAFPWLFIWFCKFAELITYTLKHLSVILMSAVAFLYTLAGSSTFSWGYNLQRGIVVLDFIPRAIAEASGGGNIKLLIWFSALNNQNLTQLSGSVVGLAWSMWLAVVPPPCPQSLLVIAASEKRMAWAFLGGQLCRASLGILVHGPSSLPPSVSGLPALFL